MTWEEVEVATKNILDTIKNENMHIDTIVPVLRGGAILGNFINNNMRGTKIAYFHVRRSESDDVNSVLGTPILLGITNAEKITGKDVLIVDDMLDKGVTMEFVLEEIKKLKPASINVAVIYDFTKKLRDEKIIAGLSMEEKKWIVYPWEKEL